MRRGSRQALPVRRGLLRRTVGALRAVDGVSFDDRAAARPSAWSASPAAARPRSARPLLRLLEPTAGTVALRRRRPDRRCRRRGAARPCGAEMQIVFQDPYASLNPRMTRRATSSPSRCGIHGRRATRRPARGDRVARAARAGRAATAMHATATRTSSPAASASASASPARWRVEPEPDRLRRAGLARSTCRSRRRSSTCWQDLQQRARPHLPLHRPRPRGRAAHRRPRRGDVPRPDRRGAPTEELFYRARGTPTPRRCCRPSRWPTRRSSAPARVVLLGRRALAGRPAVGLPLPPPLPAGPRRVREGPSSVGAGGGGGASGRMPVPGRLRCRARPRPGSPSLGAIRIAPAGAARPTSLSAHKATS